MQHGVNRVRPDHRDYDFHRTFGAVSTNVLPDEYNADLGLSFPDQNADGLPNACTGYTQSEIGQDENGELFDPKFTYEKTLAIANAPMGAPCNLRDSFKSTRTFGLKRKKNDSTLVRGAYYNVDKVDGSYFEGARSALYLNQMDKRTLSCATPWFNEWHFADKSGILPAPKNYVWNAGTVGHNFKVCGWKTIKNALYLIIKSWQGPYCGDKGYLYISKEIFDKTLNISGTALYIQSNLSASEVKTVKLDILELALDFCRRLLLLITPTSNTPSMPTIQPVAPSKAETLYQTAKGLIGQHLTLDESVDKSVGCAEAVSKVLKEAGYAVPPKGIPGTAALQAWLVANFKEVLEYQVGAIIVAATGSGNGKIRGHCGVAGEYGIMSNESQSGLWKEQWNLKSWLSYFTEYGGMETKYFVPK